MGKDVIVALDFQNQEQTLSFLDRFHGETPFVKVGMELYFAEGASIIRKIKERGHKLFLDLKLHDIPKTVEKAMRVLSRYEIEFCDIHAAGGSEMMRAAIGGLTRPDGTRPRLLAITQLTSMSEERMRRELLIAHSMEETVSRYAQNAWASGLDGVVCSPHEAAFVKSACGAEFLAVTPGIRFTPENLDDQARITTPAMAKMMGSDYIVVGRPITKASNPLEAYRACVAEFLD